MLQHARYLPLLAALILGSSLPTAFAAPYYSVGVNGWAPVSPGPGVSFQSMVMNGPKTMCLPDGGTACAPLSATGSTGVFGSVSTRVSLDAHPTPILTGSSHGDAQGWAWTEIFGGLTTSLGPAINAIVHLSYSWTQTPGSGFQLTYRAGDPSVAGVSGTIHSGALASSGNATLDLPMALAGFHGYAFQIILQLDVNSRAVPSEYPNADVDVIVRFWLELPNDVTLSDGTANILMQDATPVPAPAGAVALGALTMALARRRRRT